MEYPTTSSASSQRRGLGRCRNCERCGERAEGPVAVAQPSRALSLARAVATFTSAAGSLHGRVDFRKRIGGRTRWPVTRPKTPRAVLYQEHEIR